MSRPPFRPTKPGLYGKNGEWLGAPEPFPELDPSGFIGIAGVVYSEAGARWMTQEEFDAPRASSSAYSPGDGQWSPPADYAGEYDSQQISPGPIYKIGGSFTLPPRKAKP